MRGAELRLRPVVMTSLTAVLGLLPAALANSIGSQAQKPLAIVVVGGMLVTLFLTHYLMPVLYSFFPAPAGHSAVRRGADRRLALHRPVLRPQEAQHPATERHPAQAPAPRRARSIVPTPPALEETHHEKGLEDCLVVRHRGGNLRLAGR